MTNRDTDESEFSAYFEASSLCSNVDLEFQAVFLGVQRRVTGYNELIATGNPAVSPTEGTSLPTARLMG